ncbi:hypothetical protein [Paenibacillus sp. N3.4]|uniref:hypothetical protein n=1 Tax=Paenibacillus sp. N3.4 TaxID=2603222 RepID=UPI0011CC10AB|nr:hypothetical protein [Paenibacillus sp. N3.4]TXK74120.1 hypothetical protein FU659_29845 [Paenibacillus sp. N3.4]
MKEEHIIHFKVIHKERTQLLRGVIFLEEHQKPSISDLEQCLKDCGHDIIVEDREHAIFRAHKPGETYLIHVLEEKEDTVRDLYVESLAKNFLKNDTL